MACTDNRARKAEDAVRPQHSDMQLAPTLTVQQLKLIINHKTKRRKSFIYGANTTWHSNDAKFSGVS